jgi:hypothetical protein
LPKAEKEGGPEKGFFKTYFYGLKFAAVGRGNTNEPGALPHANYLTHQLPLQNVQLFSLRNGKKVELMGKKLVEMAERLEAFEIGKAKKWKPCVSAIFKETIEDRVTSLPPDPQPEQHQPFVLSSLWKELFHRVLNEMKGRDLRGNWYAICLNPKWLTDWKDVFFAAAKNHSAKIKVAFHSPDASRNSAAIQAQWNMNSSKFRGGSTNIEKTVGNIIRNVVEELRLWMSELGKTNADSFEFYQSNVVHPFAGLLYVPRGAKRLSKLKPVAPAGAWCVLMLYPLHQIEFETRCAIYFNAPSPMLDVYYNSILDFFEADRKRPYIEPVDLLNSVLKKSKGKARHR